MDVKRGTRGRKRGRGRGRGKKGKIISSDEETPMDTGAESVDKENEASTSMEAENTTPEEEPLRLEASEATPLEATPILPPTLPPALSSSNAPAIAAAPAAPNAAGGAGRFDMEADISQLEAPTFTTLPRGPPEPMVRLKWSHKVNLIGEKVLNPMIHCCDQCEKPILIYGRMIPCKHIFCLKCARKEPIKICPRCNDKVVRVEQSGLGTVFLCTHGGSRYGNTGCRRTYLSQRDLQAHINHRHVQTPPVPVAPILDAKQDVHGGTTRKLSESSNGAPSPLIPPRAQNRGSSSNTVIGSIPPPGAQNPSHSHSALTAANLARINNANAQECVQGKERLHQTLKKTPIQPTHLQPPETVADASYYSSVLNSFK